MSNSSQSGRKRKPLTQPNEEVPSSSKRPKGQENAEYSQKRAGVINYMILKNFMCHSLLEVNFSTNISMIIGKNGSGKSAILTGLIVGLGGKASLTNRGSSVKGFVKAGKNSGSIEIQLCNEGLMAYKPSFYGNSITIIRTLSASGSGSYKIKSEAGKIISTQAKEVQNITACLNIQIDNPICVLNQDTSRNFLSSNDPKNKFTLFMRATKLETLEAEYRRIQSNKIDSSRILEDKKQTLRKFHEDRNVLKRKIDGHKSILTLKDKKQQLQRELMWAKVRDAEEELEQEQVKFNKLEVKLNEFKGNTNKRDDEKKSLKENIRELEQKILEIKDQISVQNQPQVDLLRQKGELEEKYRNMKLQQQNINTTINSKTQEAEYLTQEISNANENMSNVEQQKMQRLRNLTAMQENLKGLEDHCETSKNDLFQLKNDLARKSDEERNLLAEISRIESKISNETSSLRALKQESGNQLILYGRSVPAVKQMIEQYKNKFVHVPRGPLGSYIKLKDKKWAVAVESYLGKGSLSAFTVDNKKDMQLLREIFNKVWQGGPPPTIITSKFVYNKHDVSEHLVAAPKNCISLYDAMIIDDPIVSNCIVDQLGTENILLIPDDDCAMQLLSDRHLVPKNCHQGITMKGDKYFPDPNYKTYASNYHRAQFLQVDTKEHLSMLQQNIETYSKNKQAIESQLRGLRNDISHQRTNVQQLEDKLKKVNTAKIKIRRQYEELHSAAEPEVQNVQYLESELEEIKKILDEKKTEADKLAESLKEIKTQIIETKEKIASLKSSTNALEERIAPMQLQIREHQMRIKEFNTNDEFDKRRLEEHERKLNEARTHVVLHQNSVHTLSKEASAVGERMSNIRKIVDISNDINDVKRSISRIETDTESITDIMKRYTELTDKCQTINVIMKKLDQNLEELSTAVERRKMHYKLTEKYFVTFMKHSFKKILEYRHFKGTIDIKMNEKKLELIVNPQHGSQGHTTTSNLSGGERSFSTVAFLYALWQCMEFPFYFLDEFDVYMDKLNRTKVIEILLYHAKSRPDLQFVFLTPQDVSFIGQDVSILRLSDPERINA